MSLVTTASCITEAATEGFNQSRPRTHRTVTPACCSSASEQAWIQLSMGELGHPRTHATTPQRLEITAQQLFRFTPDQGLQAVLQNLSPRQPQRQQPNGSTERLATQP